MNAILPLALGFAVSSLFIGLRYHQAYRRRMDLQRKRQLQGRSQNTVANEPAWSGRALNEHE